MPRMSQAMSVQRAAGGVIERVIAVIMC
jgi:hypothetical protein